MGLVLYRVPYEVAFMGTDLKSGKPVTNLLYYRSKIDVGAPALTYGVGIPGTSEAIFLGHVVSEAWLGAGNATIKILSENYSCLNVISRAIVGRAWNTPLYAIAAMSSGLGETIINTTALINVQVGDTVQIAGVTTPPSSNATHLVTVVNSPSQFRIAFNMGGSTWTGDGTVQKVGTRQNIQYSNRVEQATTILGDIAGEALPLTNSASVRRINGGVGRNWKSRISLAPIAETSQLNGKFTSAWQTLFNTWKVHALASVENVAVHVRDANLMEACSVSAALALTKPSPFTESESWCLQVSAFLNRPNLGTLNRRKPKLTAPIA